MKFLVNSTSSPQPNVISNSCPRYYFPYPTNFIPIPYHTDTSLHLLDTYIIPFAREPRVISVDVPISNAESVSHSSQTGQCSEFTFQAPGSHWNLNPQINTTIYQPVAPVAASIQSDGLLLYVSEASFEPGTSPLSSWIPISDSGKGKDETELDVEEEEGTDVNMGGEKGPLDLFQKLVSFCLFRLDIDDILLGL
jgi:snurportin-1